MWVFRSPLFSGFCIPRALFPDPIRRSAILIHPRIFHTRARTVPMVDLVRYISDRAVICRWASTQETQISECPRRACTTRHERIQCPERIPRQGHIMAMEPKPSTKRPARAEQQANFVAIDRDNSLSTTHQRPNSSNAENDAGSRLAV